MKSQLKGLLIFCVGDLIWYRRPEKSGHKLDTRWLRKAMVTARESESSYVIEIRPGSNMKVHASFLKPWVRKKLLEIPYHCSIISAKKLIRDCRWMSGLVRKFWGIGLLEILGNL